MNLLFKIISRIIPWVVLCVLSAGPVAGGQGCQMRLGIYQSYVDSTSNISFDKILGQDTALYQELTPEVAATR